MVAKIIEIVEWYQNVPADFTDLNTLIHNRRKLATYHVTLATMVSKARKEWRNLEADYEAKKNQKRMQFEAKGAQKADWAARANLETELKKTVDAENNFYDLDYLYKAMIQVLSEMNQSIAILREEEKQSKYFGANG